MNLGLSSAETVQRPRSTLDSLLRLESRRPKVGLHLGRAGEKLGPNQKKTSSKFTP